MIVYKQYKVGDLTFTLSELETDTYQCDQYSDLELNVRVLRQMGATPIDDKPEETQADKDWGVNSKLRFDYQDKPEKIEPIDIEQLTDVESIRVIGRKLNQVIKAVNSLKGE